MGTDALDADGANRLRSRIHDLEQAAIRVWWEFSQQHPDIQRLKELIAPDGPMPQPIRSPEPTRRTYTLRRYSRKGLMAEGAEVRASSEAEAIAKAKALFNEPEYWHDRFEIENVQ